MKPDSFFTKAVSVAFLLIGLAAATSLRAANHFVSMTESWDFVPSYLEIEVGDTVTWMNNDDDEFFGFEHDATSDTAAWSTGSVTPGESSSPILFSSPGNYPYHDSLFFGQGMIGTIVVNPLTTPPSPATLMDAKRLSDGSFRFTITNLTAGLETVIASSTNLTDWTAVLTNHPASGSLSFTNTPSSEKMAEFFRCWQM